MQEIEIKFKINNKEEIITKLLEENCVFSEELNQRDSIFLPDISNTIVSEGKKFIRIRQENQRVELNLKIRSKETFSSKEIEFEVSDYDLANEFLNGLGLERWVEVDKKRITTKYKQFNICIDSVKRLGDFIEIEYLARDNSDIKELEQEILALANYLHIDPEKRINSHYDTMISELDS